MAKSTKTILLVVIGVLVAILLGLIIFAAVVFNSNEFFLVLDMKGDEEITLEYGETYTEAGATAWVYGSIFMKEGLELTDIQIDNPVDTDTVGTYKVTYSVHYDDKGISLSSSIQRTVHVVDTQAPVIELVTNPNGYTFPGHPYEEEGFTATDDYDGDITDRVERVEKDGVVTYRVKDSSGNEAVVNRTIVYADPVSPVLTLLGENPLVLPVGTDYVEPGFVAEDACDGDLTAQVVVTGEIPNRFAAGTYTFTYTVTDASGNTTTATRTVVVQPANNPETVTPDGKVIYLTFDDGPSSHTIRLLDILDKYNIKATFFVVDTGHYTAMKEIVKRGHAIGIHSTTHDFYEIYTSEEAFFADLENMRQIIFEQTGVSTQLMRFPGGSSNTISRYNPGIMTRLTQAVRDMGYQYFDWNVDSKDAGGAWTTDAVVENVINGCGQRRVSVVLQHDIKGYSVDAVEQIILWGLENGYTFMALDMTSPGMHHDVNN